MLTELDVGMTASVQGYERRNDLLEDLLVRELVRARRADKARAPRAPDPSTCLVTRAQLMQRELSKAHEIAVGLFEDAEAASFDDAVATQLTAMTNLARELPDLMDLEDIDLPSLMNEQMNRLRVAMRDRLSGIVHACHSTAKSTIPKLLLIGEHNELRKALCDCEQGYLLVSRVVGMNTNFDTLCSHEPGQGDAD